MNPDSKSRIAAAMLCVLAVWPAVHFGIYARYDIDPWKLGGWAMYARPRPRQHIRAYIMNDARAFEEIALDVPSVAGELARLGRLRSALGELQSMDELGDLLLATYPETPRVRVAVRRSGFDCSNSTVGAFRDFTYDFNR